MFFPKQMITMIISNNNKILNTFFISLSASLLFISLYAGMVGRRGVFMP